MSLWDSKDQTAGKPKFLSAAEKANTVGVNIAESAANRAVGIKTPGWNMVNTYTDAQGNTRRKVECLVAMSSMTLDAEDVVTKDNLISISVHPLPQSVTAPATATFTVTAAVTGGDTISYQWQKQEGGSGAWSNVGTNSNSFTTGATSVGADNGDKYRCVLTATNAQPVTSKAVRLTVA